MSNNSPWKMTQEELDRTAFRHREMSDAITRERLAKSTTARLRAICHFPIAVAQMAFDLNRMLDLRDQAGGEWTPEHEARVNQVAGRICDEFRATFGLSLTPETYSTQAQLGDEFRRLRRSLKINLVDAADAIGISIPELSRIERGEADYLTAEQLRKIMDVLERKVD